MVFVYLFIYLFIYLSIYLFIFFILKNLPFLNSIAEQVSKSVAETKCELLKCQRIWIYFIYTTDK